MKEEITSGELLIRTLQPVMPVAVAFWMKEPDDFRYLYIAPAGLRRSSGKFAAIDVVLDAAYKLDSPDLDPMRIKVISPNEPIARDARRLNRLYPDRRTNRLGGTPLGDVYPDDLYLYPPLAEAPADAGTPAAAPAPH